MGMVGFLLGGYPVCVIFRQWMQIHPWMPVPGTS